MIEISDEEFQALINEAFNELPKRHTANIKNVALLYEQEPTPTQRQKLKLRATQSLYGLYEGVPLAYRGGVQSLYPDRITLFKLPLLLNSYDIASLKANIKHTLWHEIAHYYGLDHPKIRDLENESNDQKNRSTR